MNRLVLYPQKIVLPYHVTAAFLRDSVLSLDALMQGVADDYARERGMLAGTVRVGRIEPDFIHDPKDQPTHSVTFNVIPDPGVPLSREAIDGDAPSNSLRLTEMLC